MIGAIWLSKNNLLSYFILLALTALLFVYQCKLTRHRRREDCFKAFLNNNYVGMGVFIAFLAGIFFS
ncbi:4-hydroxybenzoate octaprenyltransferase [uncultured Avibacterium sp.]|uniref:4-hydroxybenzoate octaprenyltransferase n=1 Tax=uncultured Avibacterium sp. TaxID=1936169 RepID=A0A486XDB2_9PAST|nr:4-hydroxybenzoate octaprenyltransferase [uncultured Avibacterium sp.]